MNVLKYFPTFLFYRRLAVVFLLIVSGLWTTNVFGQAGAYVWSTSTGNALETITSPTVVTAVTGGSSDDGYIQTTPGFTFNFSGVNYTQFTAGTNAWLIFGLSTVTTIPSSLTSLSVPSVYAFGRDANLNEGNGGNITHGPASGGKYVYQYTKNSGGGSGGTSATVFITMQIVLWGTTSASPGRIDIIYGTSAGTPGSAGTIGIRDASSFVNGITGSNSVASTSGTYPVSGTMYSFSTPPPASGTSTAMGGLWSSPASWVGGIVPNFLGTATIANGATVTVDQLVLVNNLDVSGNLQWNATANAMTIPGNLTVNSGGKLLAYTSSGGGVGINIGGTYTNNGYANHSATLSAGFCINFNGASGNTLTGTGTFEGDGTNGIIRSMAFQNLGSNTISTSQNLIVNGTTTASVTNGNCFGLTAGSLNTNGKLKIDNTAQVYGRPINQQVASIAVTNMGSLYSVAPVVFGATVTQWSAITGTANTLYVSGNNVYRCTAAASIGASAPTHTTGTTDNLMWIGTVGTLGNPYIFTALTIGTQYFYGGNLYVAVNTTAPTTGGTPPSHTSGIGGPNNSFLYVGSPATATVNYDATTQTVRSLNLTSAGSGYSSAPSVAFSVGVLAGSGSGAAATAVFFQQIIGPTNSIFQKTGGTTITGGLTINSDQGTSMATANTQASSGVGSVSTTNGGVNYTIAPQLGFAGPTALNLVTNPGSGYTAAPTITVSGGTLISGSPYNNASFTINVNQGMVQSVYLTSTTAVYSVPPILTMSAPGAGVTATLEFPAGCWPAATANIGSNGQLTSFTVTNPGFGYVTPPAIVIGGTSGTTEGGTYTTAAATPTSRIGLYVLALNFFAPATAAVVNSDDASIPASRKVAALALLGNGNGLNLSGNLTCFGSSSVLAPLTLTASGNTPGNILDLGGNNLNFTWSGYGGTTSTFNSSSTNAYIKNGSMTLTIRGGSTGTLTYPFAGNTTSGSFGWVSGTGSLTTGNTALTIKVTEMGAPSNASLGSGAAMGNRAYRVETKSTLGAAAVPGTNPTVTLQFNSLDGLTTTQNLTYVADATSLTGPWTIRSTAFGASGSLPAAGTKTTATAAPGPVNVTGDNYYAFAFPAPVVTSFTPTTVCASSGSFTISGSGFNGATAVTVGGSPVNSFVVNSDILITAVAGPGTTGNVAVTANGVTGTSVGTLTLSPAPGAPTVTPPSASILPGQTASFTASGLETIFDWYTVPTGGSSINSNAAFTTPALCATTTYYVEQNNGSCAGQRTPVTVTVPAISLVSTPVNGLICQSGGSVNLDATVVAGTNYAWTGAGLNTNSGASVIASPSTTTLYNLTATNNGCTYNLSATVGVLPGSLAPTASPDNFCYLASQSTTVNSNLSAGNFAVNAIPYAPANPANATGAVTSLCTDGVANVTLSGGSLDDGGWGGLPIGFNYNFFGSIFSTLAIGTNGLIMFGSVPGYGTTQGQLGQFTLVLTPAVFPNASNPGNVIAWMAGDMNFANTVAQPGQANSIKYWNDGIAPTRRFIIEAKNARNYNNVGTPLTTVQVILYETTGIVEIHVTSAAASTPSVTEANCRKTIGLQDATKTIGAVAPGRQAFTTAITTPEAWRFSPPANYSYAWSSADANLSPLSATTSDFTATVSAPGTYNYNLAVTNPLTGCVSNAPVSFTAVTPDTFYVDNDGDGYGSQLVAPAINCTGVPAGYVANHSDCDDTNPLINLVCCDSCGANGGAVKLLTKIGKIAPAVKMDMCTGDTMTYTVGEVMGTVACYYQWKAPAGASIISGQGTTSVQVLFTSGFPLSGDTIKVFQHNGCGNSPTAILLIKHGVNKDKIAITAGSNTYVDICPGETQVYNATVTPGGIPLRPTTGYVWSTDTSALSISGGQGTSSASVIAGALGTAGGSIFVYSQNACGSIAPKSIKVKRGANKDKITFDALQNKDGICPGETRVYSISIVPSSRPVSNIIWSTTGATGYTLQSGQNTLAATFLAGPTFAANTGVVSVVTQNACGILEKAKESKLKDGKAPKGVLSVTAFGMSGLCDSLGKEFTANGAPVPGIGVPPFTYKWSLDGTLNGSVVGVQPQASNIGTVNFTPGWTTGNVQVQVVNGCGESSIKKMKVTAKPADLAAGTLTGPATLVINGGSTGVYTLSGSSAGATGYVWTGPKGSTLIGGIHSPKFDGPTESPVDTTYGPLLSITVSIGAKGGPLKVYPFNNCAVGKGPSATIGYSSSKPGDEIGEGLDYIQLFPNPAHDRMNVTFYSGAAGKYGIAVYDALGKVVLQQNGASVEGTNQTELNVSGLASGVYQLIIVGGDKQYKARFVVE